MPRMWPARARGVVALHLAAVVLTALFVVPAGAAAVVETVGYRPPVDAEVVDPFRPPSHRFGPGNRGVDYAVSPGTPVLAAARGVVAFAGRVGTSLHVTVVHPDGVRTTYSFLQHVSVRRGDRVEQGQEVGQAGDRLHFGARLRDEYLDPRSLFAGDRAHARLVPDDELRPEALPSERRIVLDLLRRLGGAAKAAVTAAGRDTPGACTPPEGAPPPPPPGRRLLVLVGGLGSSSGSAGVDAIDAAALGYAEHDVHRFSYRGGTVAERAYRSQDTAGDLREAGAHFLHLLARLADDHPGVPVDLVAHSQGGLVARDALTRPNAPSTVRTLVTLGTPHQGADLAASLLEARRAAGSSAVDDLLRVLRLDALHADAPALRQLAPGSSYLRDLARRPLPSGVHITSVAARADVVVASPRSRLDGASNVVVTVDGLHDHARLPGSATARREVALAVAGMPPTCRDRADVAVDSFAADVVLRQQRLAGPALRLGLPMRSDG